jgi:outer membrane protein assembly factor BamB
MTDSPVLSNDENTLALASGFALNIYDLDKETDPQTVQLPGKAFNIQQTPSSIYIATWNGFLLKITKSENRLAWSRKIYSSPFLFTPHESTLYAASLDGEIKYIVDNSGQPMESSPKLPMTISHIVHADSTVAIATENNRLYLYSASDISREPTQILMESPIASLQTTKGHDGNNILVGLADQSILLYSASGTPLWKFQGKNSIFMKPFISGSLAWIDQGSEVISLSLKDGSVVNRFKTPGGAGTPFVMNRTLYSASSKRILYGFSL